MAEELVRRVNRLEGDVTVLRDDVAEVKETMVEHRMRLENGTHVFAKYDQRIAAVEDAVRPRPPSVLKIVAITLTVVLAGAGALWALANMLRDRPTVEQLDKVMEGHEANGHRGLREAVHEVQREQVEQKVLLKGAVDQQKKNTEKLDEVLERLPAPRRRRASRSP